MKNKIFFTLRPFSPASRFGLACAAMLAGFILLLSATDVFAQTDESKKSEPATGLQIYRDEDGNRVMRTTPAPRNNENSNDTYYISPQIYPEMWGSDHRPGQRPDWKPHPRPGEHFWPGKNPGQLHPGVNPRP